MQSTATLPSNPAPRPRGGSRHSGFTLLEMMIAITILGILIGIGVPAFRGIIASNRLRTTTNDFSAAVNIARSEAITRNAAVTFCRVALETDTTCAASTAAWANYVVIAGGGVVRRGSIPTANNIIVRSTLADDRLVFSPDGLTRNVSGVVVSGGTITVCSNRLDSENVRQVTLGSASRISVAKSSGTCT